MTNPEDTRVRYMADDLGLRTIAADTTSSVTEITEGHGCTPTASAALGRAVTAAALLGSNLKGKKDTVTVHINGNGSAGTIIATCDSSGNLRGFIGNPKVSAPVTEDRKLNVSAVVGTDGYFSVSYDLGLKQPYSSSAPLISGEIAEDLTYYLTTSEQIPSAAGLGVLVGGSEKSIMASGGFLIQNMPSDGQESTAEVNESLDYLLTRCEEISSISHLIEKGNTPTDIIDRLTGDIPFCRVGTDELRFKCTCSRERAADLLQAVSEEYLQDALQKDEENGEVICQFCGSKYRFTAEEISRLNQKNS